MSCQNNAVEPHRGCYSPAESLKELIYFSVILTHLLSIKNLHILISEHWKVQRLVQDNVQTDTPNTW